MSFQRELFRLSVATGLRRLHNRFVHYRLLRKSIWKERLCNHGFSIDSEFGVVNMRLYHRSCPPNGAREFGWGMVSGWLDCPKVSRSDYQKLLRTSHFGDGHFEAAFYFDHANCIIYAVKNVARDDCKNARSRRLLSLCEKGFEPTLIFKLLSKGMQMHFSHVSLPAPCECVRLAVNPSLLGSNAADVISRLKTRYQRISDDLAQSQTKSESFGGG